jgi:hypothetical protein
MCISCQAGERNPGGEGLGVGERGVAEAGQARVMIAVPTNMFAERIRQLVFAGLRQCLRRKPLVRRNRCLRHPPELVLNRMVSVN